MRWQRKKGVESLEGAREEKKQLKDYDFKKTNLAHVLYTLIREKLYIRTCMHAERKI